VKIPLFGNPENKVRPSGIVIIAVLWTIASIINIYQGLRMVIADLGALSYLSSPFIHEWFRFGIPAETMLNLFIVAFGFLTLLVVYGLYTAKSWSHDFAFAIPLFITFINVAAMLLYASAPIDELRGEANAVIPFIVMNLFWLVVVWSYLSQSHVKKYLNQIPIPPPQMPVPPPSPVSVATSGEKRFCRYCGAENKQDAVFCEKCGKKIA